MLFKAGDENGDGVLELGERTADSAPSGLRTAPPARTLRRGPRAGLRAESPTTRCALQASSAPS